MTNMVSSQPDPSMSVNQCLSFDQSIHPFPDNSHIATTWSLSQSISRVCAYSNGVLTTGQSSSFSSGKMQYLTDPSDKVGEKNYRRVYCFSMDYCAVSLLGGECPYGNLLSGLECSVGLYFVRRSLSLRLWKFSHFQPLFFAGWNSY